MADVEGRLSKLEAGLEEVKNLVKALLKGQGGGNQGQPKPQQGQGKPSQQQGKQGGTGGQPGASAPGQGKPNQNQNFNWVLSGGQGGLDPAAEPPNAVLHGDPKEEEKPKPKALYVPDGKEFFYRQRNIDEVVELIEYSQVPSEAASEEYDPDFHAELDFNTAFTKLKNGDVSIYDQIEAANQDKDDLTPAPKREFNMVRDYSGSEVLIADFLEHNPEHMIEHFPKQIKEDKFLDIVLNCSASGWTKGSELFSRAKKIFAHVKALELSGRRCQFSVGDRTSWQGKVLQQKIVIKRFNESISPGVLAWCMCSPDFLRRISFRLYELEPPEIREAFGFKTGEGYGSPGKYDAVSSKEIIYNITDSIWG